jgi:hypothetical protein
VLATVIDMCRQKPGTTYDFPKDQKIYAATRVTLSRPAVLSSGLKSTTSTTSATSSPKASSSNGLSKGVLAGLVVGALVGTVILLAGVRLILRHKKNERQGAAHGDQRVQQASAHEVGMGQVAQYETAELSGREKVEMRTESMKYGARRF